jgi:hypothetical protein
MALYNREEQVMVELHHLFAEFLPRLEIGDWALYIGAEEGNRARTRRR